MGAERGVWAQDALEKEKQRSSKQQQLSTAAIQAANKRANTFEALYEAAKADASSERDKVAAYRVAAEQLNKQLEFNGPDGSFPISLLQTSGVIPARTPARSSSLGTLASPKAKITAPATAKAKPPSPAAPKSAASPKPAASALSKKVASQKAIAVGAKKTTAKATSTKAPAQPTTPLLAAPPSPRSSVESVKA